MHSPSKKSPLHIGILCTLSWGGGAELLRRMVHALKAKQKSHTIQISLFIPSPAFSLKQKIKIFLGKASQSPYLTKKQILNMLDIASENAITLHTYQDTESALIKVLHKHNIDVVLPLGEAPSKNFTIPWVGYIFDFQHKYLPHLFTVQDIEHREKNTNTLLNTASTILVNAQAVKHDIQTLYAPSPTTVFALPFCPMRQKTTNVSIIALRKKYALPKNFFIISNQFWMHKNHKVAFKALRVLKKEYNQPAHIVCTGATHDNRFPAFFSELKGFVQKQKLENNILFLGHIPRKDQLTIMQHAQALIQPTLFEGGAGGFATYDAVSLGLPVILSDIPVNKEVVGDNIFYFKSNNAIDLAKYMYTIIKNPPNKPTAHDLQKKYLKDKEKFAETLFHAITHAYTKKHSHL